MTAMRCSRGRSGFTLVEVMIAVALIGVGALVALSVIAASTLRNEQQKEQALAYKACQDVMEALMSMDKATLVAQLNYQQATGQPSSFQLSSLNPAAPPTGTYAVEQLGGTLPDGILVEFRVRFSKHPFQVALTSRRYLP